MEQTFQIKGNRPIWSQLTEQLTERIISGVYPPGTRFPTVRDLAEEANVNPNTMQRALSQLEADGLVSTHRTTGRMVTEDLAVMAQTRRKLARERAAEYFSGMQVLGYGREEAAALLMERGELESNGD